MFRLHFGVRQDSVFSPYLFALYLDDLSGLCLSGCTITLSLCKRYTVNLAIDFLARKTSTYLQKQLHWLDMAINFKKSRCLRIGPCCDAHCTDLRSMTGFVLLWVDTIRYLGVHFVPAKYFKCSLDYAKCSFRQAANSIFGRPFVKRFALCYRTVVLPVCPVCDVCALWPNGLDG